MLLSSLNLILRHVFIALILLNILWIVQSQNNYAIISYNLEQKN